MRGCQDHFSHKKVFTVRIRGCSHFVKLKCIRKKWDRGKVFTIGGVHSFGVFTSRGFTVLLIVLYYLLTKSFRFEYTDTTYKYNDTKYKHRKQKY